MKKNLLFLFLVVYSSGISTMDTQLLHDKKRQKVEKIIITCLVQGCSNPECIGFVVPTISATENQSYENLFKKNKKIAE